MIKDSILRTVVALMIPIIILYGLYIQFHGDYSPGGGFQAGVIIASAIILYAILFGPEVAVAVFPILLINIVSIVGILIYGGTGVIAILLEKEFLNYGVLLNNSASAHKLGILIVELGVGLTVCCSMLTIYFSFASFKKQ